MLHQRTILPESHRDCSWEGNLFKVSLLPAQVSSIISAHLPVPNFNSLGPNSQTQIYSTLLGFVSSEIPLSILLMGHVNITAMQMAFLSKSSVLPHAAPPSCHYLEHFLCVNRSSELTSIELFPCDIHYSKHLTCITLTGLPNNLK